MLTRIGLILIALMLALPAVAAPLCHPAPAVAQGDIPTGTGHHAMNGEQARPHHATGGDHQDKAQQAAKRHDCIGCAARFALPQLAGPSPLPPLALTAPVLDPLHGIASSPALPPPRF